MIPISLLWAILAAGSGFVAGYVCRWRRIPFIGKVQALCVRRLSRFSIGILTGSSLSSLSVPRGVTNPVLGPEAITDVRASFVADPFLCWHGGKWFMFMEVMNRTRRLGEIGCAISDDGLKWSYQSIVLREPFHLSYPYVFEYRDQVWMIPESARDYSVRLYRAVDFPTQWRLERRLLEGYRYSDPSVFQHNGSWWMFVSRNNSEDLLLYYADDVTGPWQHHPQSPIVYGQAGTARCAGRPVHLNGKLIRFAQDCEREYGRAVRAFKIDRLDRKGFRESELVESPVLCPSGEGWNAGGMHHIDLHIQTDKSYVAAVDGWRTVRAVGVAH